MGMEAIGAPVARRSETIISVVSVIGDTIEIHGMRIRLHSISAHRRAPYGNKDIALKFEPATAPMVCTSRHRPFHLQGKPPSSR